MSHVTHVIATHTHEPYTVLSCLSLFKCLCLFKRFEKDTNKRELYITCVTGLMNLFANLSECKEACKKNLEIWKETYKRELYMVRVCLSRSHVWHDSWICVKIHLNARRHLKKTCIHEKETRERVLQIWKETYKRELCMVCVCLSRSQVWHD